MSDFQRVDPKGWEYDLHSVYSAYLGHFQLHNVPWYERSWGHYFESFQDFLTYSWAVIVVTDEITGKAHIVTRASHVAAFVKMIRTRFGDTLPQVNNMLTITPLESSSRRLHTIAEWSTYKKLHATLPAAVLAAQKSRVRGGDPVAIKALWSKRDKTFMAIDFEWSERNSSTVLEWGYAAVRCGHLSTVGTWPPDPETNYRQGHYVIEDYINQQHNKRVPNHPWQYAFGDSQRISKSKLSTIIQAIISSLATPDSETTENNLVLVGHAIQGDLQRLEDLKIKLPGNVLIIDTSTYERQLFNSGVRGQMTDGNTTQPRTPGSSLSLGNMIRSQGINPTATLHNAGNDAFFALLSLQMFLDPKNTTVPPLAGQSLFPRATPPNMLGAMPTASLSSPVVSAFPAGYMQPSSTSPAALFNAGYFTPQRQSPGFPQMSSMPNRTSQVSRSLMPDETGALPARSKSSDRLSSTMRDLSLG